MSKNIGRSYHTKQSIRLVNALNTMTFGTVLDWLYRRWFSLKDVEAGIIDTPLSLKKYLEEVKESAKADKRMEVIEARIESMSSEEKEKRNRLLDEQRGEGEGWAKTFGSV